MENSCQFSIEPTTNIIFVLTNNHLPHQLFVKKKNVKQFIPVALLNLGLLDVNADFFNKGHSLECKPYIRKVYGAKCNLRYNLKR